MIPTITKKLNIGSAIDAAFKLFTSVNLGGTPEPATPPSALLHPDPVYGRQFAGAASTRNGHSPCGWLAMSGLGMVMSAFMNFLGFKVVFPDKTLAALMMALMLEGFVVGTGVLIKRANRRARPWLLAMALLFGGTSVMLSVAGMNAGAEQFQQDRNLPQYEHEDAIKAEGIFATATSQTESAALGRITNEFSFFAKQNALLGTAGSVESGFVRDRAQRQSDLNDLKVKWHALDFSSDLANAKSTDQIWTVLRHEWALLQPLVAETNKLTSGHPISMPAYPVAPDHAAEDAHLGKNDATGMNSLKRPSLRWLFIIPLALMMDFGPMLTAAAMRVLEKGDAPEDEAGGPDYDGLDPDSPEPHGTEDLPIGLHEDWDERKRRMQRVGDDLRIDPLAAACSAAVHAAVVVHQAVEARGLANLTLMRSFEMFEEEAAIIRDAATRIGIGPEAVRAHLDDAFGRLQERLKSEQQLRGSEHARLIQKLQDEQDLQAASDRFALAKQIADLQAEMDALSHPAR
jgi:hypothetical protein